VRRSLAVLLAAALSLAPVAATSLHVHTYVGHDHPEHHHGPAVHDHHSFPLAPHADHETVDSHDEAGTAVTPDACDPGDHAAAVKIACADRSAVHATLAELPRRPIVSPSMRPSRPLAITDTRAHSPPAGPCLPARAPPLTNLA
jgi:hypothetical protein